MRPRLLDLFCGEGGAAAGYVAAGFDVLGVDNNRGRLSKYPYKSVCGDAIEILLGYGDEFDAIHASPTCTGYSRGTAAIPDRFERYDRLIAATRDAVETIGRPYVIENVEDARSELRNPILLCGRQFGLGAIDTDGTPLVLDRHRLFESNAPLLAPEHPKHDPAPQVAGAYGGARRDKWEAKHVRKGGYVPRDLGVLQELLGTPWMSERGCFLSIPPAYTEFIGAQLIDHLASERVA